MTLLCLGSVKGSPGVTLTSLLTAAAWPTADDRRKLLVEADPDGGALALRYQMPTRPGLLSLAAATGNTLSRDGIWDHAQSLPGGLPVVVAPTSPEQASVALRSVGANLGDWLSASPIDVLADVGRLSPTAPTHRFLAAADAVLMVARPVADQLQPAAYRMASLAKTMQVGWVLIGDRPYSPEDVAEAFHFPVVAVIPFDQRTAARISDGVNPHRLRRSPLLREVARFAGSLSGWLAARQTAARPAQSAENRENPGSPDGSPHPTSMQPSSSEGSASP